MPLIDLTAIGTSGVVRSSKNTILQQDYGPSYIFKRYEYKLGANLNSENITVSKNKHGTSTNSVTLTPGSKYKSASLEKAHVYFNKYDQRNAHPLLLVLCFKDDTRFASKYYKISVFDQDVIKNPTKEINELTDYAGENSILASLIEENDRIDDILTFVVNTTTQSYNNSKINVTKSELKSSDQSNVFEKYVHTPTSRYSKSKACVLYKQQVLLWWKQTRTISRMEQITNIQNVKIFSMSVYYGPKNSEPLVVEFDIENDKNREISYYFQKISSAGLFWQRLDESSSRFLLDTTVGLNQIHTKLTSDSNKLLIKALNKIDNYLIKLLIVLVDKRNEYLGTEVIETLKISQLDTSRYILANTNGKIEVKDISSDMCKSIGDKGYIVIEHDLKEIFKTYKPAESATMKFILSNQETNAKNSDILTIILDYQHHRSYSFQSRLIQVSSFFNPIHKYKWYIHSCEHEIIRGNFQLLFDGQYVTLEGDLGDSSYNTSVFVYFSDDYRDRFILVAFPDKKLQKIRYMTYSQFTEKVRSRSMERLTQLEEMEADINKDVLKTGRGYKIDDKLLSKLQMEYKKLESDRQGSISDLDYVKGQDKVYVYLSASNSQILMICYNNKAYKRYYLSRNRSSWKQVTGVNSCICNSNSDGESTSDKKLFESLSEIETLYKKKDFNQDRRHSQEEQQNLLKKTHTVDILKTQSSEDSTAISLSSKQAYRESNLFVYFTHNPKGETELTIESLTLGDPYNKTIKLKKHLTNVKSVIVYFNKFFLSKPLVLCIITGNGHEKYYKDLIKDSNLYTIDEDSKINSANLTDQLIEHNDKINKTCTFQIDKTTVTGDNIKYGNEASITVTKKEYTQNQFILYNHKQTGGQPLISYVLQKRNLLDDRSGDKTGEVEHIHGKRYRNLKVYSLTKESDSLFIEFEELSSIYYALKKDGSGLYWGKENFDFKDDSSIKNKLDEINYLLKSSVIIEIDKGAGTQLNKETKYEMKLIENRLNKKGQYDIGYSDAKKVGANKITATVPSKIPETNRAMTQSGYNYVKHEIPNSTSLSSLDVNTANIAGIRLFLSKSNSQPQEVFLYSKEEDARTSKNRLNLYYSLPSTSDTSSKIYVYFHGEDTRPLVICFNGKIYKRRNNKDTEWVCVKDVKCHLTSEILSTLKSVYKSMKRKINFAKEGGDKHISTIHKELTKGYKKITYSPNYSTSREGPFVLSKSTLMESMSDSTIVTKLLDSLDKRTFNTITKYYKDNKKPLLLEFDDEYGKTHIVRKDDVKYWTKEKVDNVESELSKIESSVVKTTVYEIDQIKTEYNTNITLKPDAGKPTKDFSKYTHTPKTDSNKSILLYNLDKLKNNNEPLKEIRDQIYTSVAVYFGNKAKNESKFVPLIIELTTSGTDKKYYKHKLERSLSNWEPLTIPSPDDNNKKLIEELKKTEFELVESVVVLLEKTDNEPYGDDEIQMAMKKHDPIKKFNLADINSKSIKVSIKNTSEVKCISDYGYKVFEHDLSSCFKGAENYGLRFFILTSNSTDTYKEIQLCDSDSNIDTLYYDKNAVSKKDKVYVYFYSKDPRPLLACYNGIAYRPKSCEDYEKKWLRENKITKCLCENNSDGSGLLNALTDIAKSLNVVLLVKRPNVPNPENDLPDNRGIHEIEYPVRSFNKNDIKIKVTYENKKCYRVYKHKPYVNDGLDEGYRLGEIKYELASQKRNGLEYKSYKPLTTVYVYYSVYDGNHENILLVVLEFKGNDNTDKEYYKLKKKGNKEWVKMEESGSDGSILAKLKEDSTFEDGLYDLRQNLEIKFSDKDSIKKLFKADKCEEDKIDIGAIAGGTVAGVGTVATVVGVVVVKKLGIAAFTTAAAAAAAAS